MEAQKMLKIRKIAVLALPAVIVVAVAVALSLVLTCSAVDIPVMQPELDNAAVDPGETETWNQTFTYAVNCIFSDTVSITLEVYSLSLHDWTARGDRAYTGTGEWQSLTWADVKLCSGKCEGTSSYRFRYNGSILLTESGPTIAPPTPLPPTVEIFKNAMVKPAYGHYNDSFTYSVFARLNQTLNITMEIFDISSYEWKTIGEAYYSDKGNWQLLSWADVTIVPAVDSAGVASYRFFFIDAGARRESVVFYGPELGLYPTPAPAPVVIRRGGGGGISRGGLLEDEVFQKELAEKLGPFIVPGCVEIKLPVLSNDMVTPTRGSWHQSYNYSVVVEHPDRADMWLTLVVYCPGQRENRTISSQAIWDYNETTNRATVEWRDVNVFSEKDVRANELPGYYIYYNDGCNKDFWWLFGPELYFTPVLTEPSVSPEEGTYKEQFEYKVHVMDEDGDDVDVTLYIFDAEGSEIYNETHIVSGIKAKSGKTVSWRYNKFSEREADKTLKYSVTASDGIVHAIITEKGPHINSAEKVPPINITEKVPPINITGKVPPINITGKVPPINITGKVPHIEPVSPLELISGLFLLASIIVIPISLYVHEGKVKAVLKNAGLDFRENRKNLQINDPNISFICLSWLAVVVALLVASLKVISLRIGMIRGGILTLILIILISLLISWSFGYLPILKFEHQPLRRCYQECRISKRNYYKILSGVSFVLALISILFAFGGYAIPYYHDSLNILGIYISGLYLHSSVFFISAICILLLLSPMLSDCWRWRKIIIINKIR